MKVSVAYVHLGNYINIYVIYLLIEKNEDVFGVMINAIVEVCRRCELSVNLAKNKRIIVNIEINLRAL